MSRTKVITLEGLEYYDEHGFPVRAQSSILTIGAALVNLVQRVDELEANGGVNEFAIPIDPTVTPTSAGAVWFETEGGV